MSTVKTVEAFRHRSPIDPPRHAGSGPQDAFEHIVVRLTDVGGAVGYGECDPIPGALALLNDLARTVIGTDPLEREATVGVLRRQLVSSFPISAFSIALDDLAARQLGVPIAGLYGGALRRRVQAYAASYGSLAGRVLESWLAEAAEVSERGFGALKIRLGVLPLDEECRALQELRRRAPKALQLMADGNAGFNATAARAIGRCAFEAGVLWLEEPLRQDGYIGYPELAAELVIPLAGGELTSGRAMAVDLLLRGAVDVIQPDPVICGGIGETIFIADLARLFGRLAVPHTSGGAIGVAAGLQAVACIPDQSLLGQNELLFLEYPALIDPIQREIAPALPVPRDGWIDVPVSPGLGLEIDGAAVEALAVERLRVE